MKLQLPFTTETRWLFHDARYTCFDCGGNGQGKGGVELHHILGRTSSSPFNACPLCKECHDGVKQNSEGKKKLLTKTVRFLLRNKYKMTDDDELFLNNYKHYYL